METIYFSLGIVTALVAVLLVIGVVMVARLTKKQSNQEDTITHIERYNQEGRNELSSREVAEEEARRHGSRRLRQNEDAFMHAVEQFRVRLVCHLQFHVDLFNVNETHIEAREAERLDKNDKQVVSASLCVDVAFVGGPQTPKIAPGKSAVAHQDSHGLLRSQNDVVQ